MLKKEKITLSVLTIIIFTGIIIVSSKLIKSNDSNTTSFTKPNKLIECNSNLTNNSDNYSESKITETSAETTAPSNINETVDSNSTTIDTESNDSTLANNDQLYEDTNNYTSSEISYP